MSRFRTAAPWLVAVLLTLALAAFQRLTGPTHPIRGRFELQGREHAYRLPRSHGGPAGLEVRVSVPPEVTGTLLWRRYPTDGDWQGLPMSPSPRGLGAEIPHQPPAGKVEYRLVLEDAGRRVMVPSGRSVVARFKGKVPAAALIPHILAMFTGMLVATRALLAAVVPGSKPAHRSVLVAAMLMAVGGLVLGPIVQRHAFGAYWTGWPLGEDLTDTKTLVAILAWLPATAFALRRRTSRVAVVIGWTVMMGIFLIPHSRWGSQLDWESHPAAVREAPSDPRQ